MTGHANEAERLRRELRERFGINLGTADDGNRFQADPGDGLEPDDGLFLKAAEKTFPTSNPGYWRVVQRIRKERSADGK
jgi:hypothetical protein